MTRRLRLASLSVLVVWGVIAAVVSAQESVGSDSAAARASQRDIAAAKPGGPIPRRADGKPDLTGNWNRPRTATAGAASGSRTISYPPELRSLSCSRSCQSWTPGFRCHSWSVFLVGLAQAYQEAVSLGDVRSIKKILT